MVFSSYVFIFGFLPIALVGFLLLSKFSTAASKVWLCLASLVFYGWWDIKWIPVLLISILFNYIVGYIINSRAADGKSVMVVMSVGVTANILALIYYKYLFSLLTFFGIHGVLAESPGLPLGISFFTFTQIAFLIDAGQGIYKRYTPVNYLLFVTFFPHLIAGPIVHHHDLMPQFEEPKNYRFQPLEFAIGLSIFSIGLAKKTLIADNAAEIANRLLGSGHTGVAEAWIGVLSYSLQLYFDFSGYSDMAIGLARMFGIKFPINFNSPYKATSIIDFWQRWHITLTRFLTSYLYNPIALFLVRRRASAGRSTSKRASKTLGGFFELIALPTSLTMLIAGVWHGVGFQFVVFGLLHGAYLSINHAWRNFGPKAKEGAAAEKPSILTSLAYGLLVYLAVMLAQIFFRATSASDAMTTVASLVGFGGGVPASNFVKPLDLIIVVVGFGIALLAPNTQEIMADHEPALALGRNISGSRWRAKINAKWAIAFGVILFLGLVSIRDGQPFIYFQF